MTRETQEYISDFEREILERLVRLETSVELGFKSTDKALILARESLDKDRILAKADLDRHLESLNASGKKIERLEGTFATKEDVAKEFKSVNRIIYLAVGIFIAFEFIFKYLIK